MVSYRAVPTTGPHGEPQTPNDNDYDGTTNVLQWTEDTPAQQSVTIAVYADDVVDPNKYLAVELFNPTGKVKIANGSQHLRYRFIVSAPRLVERIPPNRAIAPMNVG